MGEQHTWRRIYEPPAPRGGHRILVDRVWPRGVRRDEAHLDEWLRDIAPSTHLRQWYGHEPGRFEEFRRRYLAELDDPDHEPAVRRLRELAAGHRLVLLTATRDAEHSHAAILADWLTEMR